MNFSLVICVYRNDDLQSFNQCIDSILNQTLLPNEIIIVEDGQIAYHLEKRIIELSKNKIFKIVRIFENKGPGYARNIGIKTAKNKYVAIMDADDICVTNRFELQIKYLKKHPKIDVLGGLIAEFIDDPNKRYRIRYVPSTDKMIKKYLKRRCPFNNMTVIFKKSKILEVGGYENIRTGEDYYLWSKLSTTSVIFANLPQVIVLFRATPSYYQRRGTYQRYKNEVLVQKYLLSNNIISLPGYYFNILIRFFVLCILSNNIRTLIYNELLRKKYQVER